MAAAAQPKISLHGDFSEPNPLPLLLILITWAPIYVEETGASFLLRASLPRGIGQLMVSWGGEGEEGGGKSRE